ncbi:TonB-dependent receptor [Dysgonomonas sp. Marseille-P4677]|uniref:SusC/RagA family TonB-linked outer membrane protein n=1 Tax=Dysgonomonas sp. Marseille-P4677 TaxID=2364790 RepID=UPI0019121947|nr:TonB-dependent receptor [Dysgonomonas sp. Marseille-P4677]MBK5721535.1 TonB-dependent receptor [Dysgonomonas sp. Marseille-P4677]
MERKSKNRCTKMFLMILLGIFTLSTSMYAQDRTITVKGNVKDNNNEPIISGSVVVKGTTTGTVTDLDGNFELKAPSNGTLVFSYVGFTTQEISIDGKTTIDVILSEDAELLQEVVVIGYGSVKKEDLTGAVTTISANSLAKGMATSASDLLVGKAPGVSVISDGGAPGASTTIRIRGGSSMSASNDPLIVIDGVPVDNSTGIKGMANPLSTINPNDIENFTVLKDASATAIYGSRASNGVIIITTKKGALGSKAKVNYSGTFSVSTKTGTVDVMGADEFRQFVNDMYGTESDQYKALGDVKTNWQDEIFRTSFSTDHNIGVSGAAGIVPYRVSLGYTNENGILKTSNLERWTGAINLNPKFFNNMLSVQFNVKGIYNLNRFADTGAIGAATEFNPTQPVYMPNYKAGDPGNGYYLSLKADGKTPIDIGLSNPVDALESKHNTSRVKRSIGNMQFDYKFHFLPDLRANLNLGYDYSNSLEWKNIDDNSVQSWVTGKFKSGFGENETYSQVKKNYLMDFYLNYVKELNKHRIDVMGGYSWQKFYRYDSTGYPYSLDMQAKKGETYYATGKSYASENYLISFFGRVNYTFDSRYLLTFTLRDDGSSRFAKGNRWGLFPSAALAWRISEEGFMKNQNLMSDLKLRLGYGVTGQQNLPDIDGKPNNYPYMAKYLYSKGGANYYWGDERIQLLRPSAYDRDLKWEETTTYNAGLDFGFLGNRISGNVDVYYRKTKDLINNIFIAAGTNFSNQLLTNQGELTNKGVELNITGHVIETKDLNWTLGYNISYNKNKITKMLDFDNPNYKGIIHGGITGGTGNNVLIHALNNSYNSFYVYEQIYNADGRPIEGAYVDQNKDGVIDTEDLITYKKSAPDVFMGLSSQLTYKNWDFNFALRASIGNYAYNNVQSNREAYGGSSMLDPTGFLKNRVSSARYTDFKNPQYLSSYYVQDASFVRMDNISIGYTFLNIAKGLSSMRVYGTVQNPFVITKYKGLDPEFNNEGIDNNIYPRPRIFMLGLNMNF